MEEGAMRHPNLIGNKFFNLAFSWLLGRPIKDTLCGTEVLRRSAYQAIAANRSYFGNFDPFGESRSVTCFVTLRPTARAVRSAPSFSPALRKCRWLHKLDPTCRKYTHLEQ
jgi:hypothetical protein